MRGDIVMIKTYFNESVVVQKLINYICNSWIIIILIVVIGTGL